MEKITVSGLIICTLLLLILILVSHDRPTIPTKDSRLLRSGSSFEPHRYLGELLERVTNQSQGLYNAKTENKVDIHAPSGIKNHDPYVPVSEDSTTRRSRGYFDPQLILFIM
jgi:hypothetical protein